MRTFMPRASVLWLTGLLGCVSVKHGETAEDTAPTGAPDTSGSESGDTGGCVPSAEVCNERADTCATLVPYAGDVQFTGADVAADMADWCAAYNVVEGNLTRWARIRRRGAARRQHPHLITRARSPHDRERTLAV